MTPPIPHVDGRGRTDITGAAAAAVRARLPRWTGQDRTDPGQALIECCADMVEALRDRLNRAPDRHRLELLRMLGVRPHRAAPARTEVMFQLAAPSPEPVPIPAGLEVSTRPVREEEEPVVFSTVTDALVNPCVLITAGEFRLMGAADGVVEGSLAAFGPAQPDTVEPRGLPFAGPAYHLNLPWFGDFTSRAGQSEPPEPDPDVVLVVLSVPVPDTRITLDLTLEEPGPREGGSLVWSGLGEETEDGAWEVWQGSDWAPCRTVTRTAGADGGVRVTLDVPANHAPTQLYLHLFRPDGPAVPWRLRDVGLIRRRTTWYPGPTEVLLQPVLTVKVPVVQALLVRDELLGTAAGVPGERLRFAHPPLLPAVDTFAVEAVTEAGTSRWVHVPSLAGSGPHDRHFTLDPRTGEAVFAPVARTARGLRRHGAPLPPGASVHAPRYLTGGGARGNVPARTITALRTPLPYVAAVTNPAPAAGGTEAESPEAYAARLPLGSPVPERAVTPRDYEELALAASAGMARIHHVRADNDDALDPARNYRMPVPATTEVRFRLAPGVPVVPAGTEVMTEDGKVFTTTAPGRRGAVRTAGMARLVLDPAATGAHDLFTAGDFLQQGPVGGPFRPGGALVVALVHVPADVALKGLTLWVRPNRTVAAGERMALSVFLPRTGIVWWNPEAPAAYASSPAESVTVGGAAVTAHPLSLARSPRWRPDTDRPAASAEAAVAVKGTDYPGAGGAWLALQIRDPKGNESTTYTVGLDDGATGKVTAAQYVKKKAGPMSHGGAPGESFALMEGRLRELPKVRVAGEEWEPVSSFATSNSESKHVVISASTGQVFFGPEIRDATGNTVRHGKVPGKGAEIKVDSYHSTLGGRGNDVPEGGIRRLRTPVPGVESVWNTKKSSGGDDGYTDTSGGTFQAGVRLLIVPHVTADDRGWFPFHMLTPSQDACDVLRRSLRARQPAGVPVWLDTPDYRGLRIDAQVVPTDYRTAAERAVLAAAAERALYRWFSPVEGGPDGTGWPLGRPVHAGDAYRVLERVPGVARVGSLRLFEADPRSGGDLWEVTVLPCGDRQTVYCVAHRVTVAETP
ncbi:baseplate J/gp47 family protein [Streptomyces cinnamoneus]|uniref:baseplate J/gp47 family protein n=1 Tax=Streptomyces cinnamoneus TaxID=53446 RepID=UPI0033FB7188